MKGLKATRIATLASTILLIGTAGAAATEPFAATTGVAESTGSTSITAFLAVAIAAVGMVVFSSTRLPARARAKVRR